MPKPKRTRGTNLRSGPASTATAPHPEPGQPSSEEGHPQNDGVPPGNSGEWLEYLDPRIIVWPTIRITSQYDDESTASLRRSLEEDGQEGTVIVTLLEDGTYEGADGMNSCLASVESGTARIRCFVRRGSHRDVVKANLAMALNQSRPNPLSGAEGIANALYEEGFSLPELMTTTGKSEQWIEDRLSINEASPAVKQCLGDGTIAIGHALVLAGLVEHADQEETLSLQLTHRWTVKELEDHINGTGGEAAGQAQTGPRARDRKPLTCSYCGKEQDPAQVQTLTVCQGCMETVGPGPDRSRFYRLEDGELVAVTVTAEFLREVAVFLAGSQAGAPLAERISELMEGATDGRT